MSGSNDARIVLRIGLIGALLTPQRRAASGTARFRTFQVCPKDLPIVRWQAERAGTMRAISHSIGAFLMRTRGERRRYFSPQSPSMGDLKIDDWFHSRN